MREQENERLVESNAADDALLEAFLTETMSGHGPPDLRQSILTGLRAAPQVMPAGRSGRARAKSSRSDGAVPGRTFAATVSLVASLAAAVVVVVTLWQSRSENRSARPPVVAEAERPDSPAAPQDASPSTQRDDLRDGPKQEAAELPVSPSAGLAERGVPRKLSMEDLPFSQGASDNAEEAVVLLRQPATRAETDAEIAARVDSHLATAWQELGVVPTGDVSPAEMVRRIDERLQLKLGEKNLGDEAFVPAEAVAMRLRESGRAGRLSDRLLPQLLGPAWKGLEEPSKGLLVDFVARQIERGERFDEVIRSLLVGGVLDGAEAASQAWLTALAGPQSLTLTQQLGQSLLDKRLACARCHDHPMDAHIQQHDFWSLAALLDNSLLYQRSDDGQPIVQLRGPQSPQQEANKGLFYERPDGRKRVAMPGVALSWMDLQRAEKNRDKQGARAPEPAISNLGALAAGLKDNPQLARALVNRMWAAMYGRPLTADVSDPDAPPQLNGFVDLRDYLADQLRARDFDLAALAGWVATAAPMRRSLSLEPLSDKAAFASNEQLAEAEYLQRVFAGYEQPLADLRFEGLLAMASRWNGGQTVDSLPTLAQPVPGASISAKLEPRSRDELLENWLRTSFPGSDADEAPLPAQWLGSISSFDQQVRHLYYAAGFWNPSRGQLQAAASLRESAASDQRALRQLWWALRHSRS